MIQTVSAASFLKDMKGNQKNVFSPDRNGPLKIQTLPVPGEHSQARWGMVSGGLDLGALPTLSLFHKLQCVGGRSTLISKMVLSSKDVHDH